MDCAAAALEEGSPHCGLNFPLSGGQSLIHRLLDLTQTLRFHTSFRSSKPIESFFKLSKTCMTVLGL